jgi:hypothetical protein
VRGGTLTSRNLYALEYKAQGAFLIELVSLLLEKTLALAPVFVFNDYN